MEPTLRDDRADAREACLGEAFDWLVRLNRLRGQSEAEALALQRWCARSALHAQAWREALALWRALLPAACAAVQRSPRRPHARRARGTGRTADARAVSDRIVAAARGRTPFFTHSRPGQSWS
jgi:ferric-dicitrate binding protein FerR (iron transport regulator)